MRLPDAPGGVQTRSPEPVGGSSEPLHVLALIDHLVLGGAEMLLAQFAAAAPRAGIDLSVACLCELDGNPAATALLAAGLVPVNLDVPGAPRLATLRAVRAHLARLRPAIVHTHLGDADLVGGIAARTLGIPVVSTIHTASWSRGAQTYIRRMLIRMCADRIIAVSDSAREVYRERGFARRDQLVTIRNGVELTALPGTGADLRAELGWREDDLVLGMLSALRALKGHDVAVAAFRQLMEEFPNLKLLIIGRGKERPAIERMTADLGPRVALLDHRFDVMRCLDAFDICLQPSRTEAFPTTLIEAMAASVPAVATAVGGIPEIVEDGRTGLLVPAPPTPDAVAAALRELLGDRPRRLALGQAARAVYERRFTVEPWVQSTRRLYDAVLAERHPTAGLPPTLSREERPA